MCETRLYNALNDRLRERHGIVTAQFEFCASCASIPATAAEPADRRSSLALTKAGTRLAEAAEETFTEQLTELLAGTALPAAARAFAHLRAALERDQIGLPTG